MTLQDLESKLKPLQDPLRGDALKWLYLHFPPQPITSRKMHHAYSATASTLMRELEAESLDASVQEAAKLFLGALLPFIEAYEKSRLAVPAATPEEMFRFLIEQHDLSQYDLAKEVGGQPVVSDIVRGKRKLTRDHIEKLGRRFHISPAAFYPA